jgi:hypothetical protein
MVMVYYYQDGVRRSACEVLVLRGTVKSSEAFSCQFRKTQMIVEHLVEDQRNCHGVKHK